MSLDHHAFRKLRVELIQATITFQHRHIDLQNQRRCELKIYMDKALNPRRPSVCIHFGNDEEASICVKTKEVLSSSMRSSLLESAASWVAEHETDLINTWDKIRRAKKPKLLWTQ